MESGLEFHIGNKKRRTNEQARGMELVSKLTWAIQMMAARNLGCTAACVLRRAAMGLEMVLMASVPSFINGSIMVAL